MDDRELRGSDGGEMDGGDAVSRRDLGRPGLKHIVDHQIGFDGGDYV